MTKRLFDPRTHDEKEQDRRMKTQTAEFDAVKELAEQYRRVTMTAIVDDDYPGVRAEYEEAVRKVIRAFRENGR